MTRAIALFSAASVLLGLIVGGVVRISGRAGRPVRRLPPGRGGGRDGRDRRTVRADERRGRAGHRRQVISRPTLVYFGYTFCPDVCPLDLARNARATDLLAERGIDVGPGLHLDRPRPRHPRGRGRVRLGDPSRSSSASPARPRRWPRPPNAYRVYYRKAGDDPEFYTMDHSTFTYLVAPERGLPRVLRLGRPRAEQVAESVACFVGVALSVLLWRESLALKVCLPGHRENDSASSAADGSARQMSGFSPVNNLWSIRPPLYTRQRRISRSPA